MEMPSSLQTTAVLPARRRRDRAPAVPTPELEPETAPRRARGPVEIRTDGGWTFEIPAPAAILGTASLALLALFALADPVSLHEAWVDRQADQVQRWENGDHARLQKSLDAIKMPL